MARNRMIKPEFWTDTKIIRLTPLARLLFIGLWNHADDAGRLKNDPDEFKLRILPMDNCDAAELRDELLSEGLVRGYAVDGVEYLCIPKWKDHQAINRPSESKIPPPPTEPRVAPVLEKKKSEAKPAETVAPAPRIRPAVDQSSVTAVLDAYAQHVKPKSEDTSRSKAKIWINSLLKRGAEEKELLAAVRAYGAICERKCTEMRYRKNSENFFGNGADWEQYIEMAAAASDDRPVETLPIAEY